MSNYKEIVSLPVAMANYFKEIVSQHDRITNDVKELTNTLIQIVSVDENYKDWVNTLAQVFRKTICVC